MRREDWLEEKIIGDLLAMADEREKMLLESKELQNINMPEEKLEDIHKEFRRRHPEKVKGEIHLRLAMVLVAVMILVIGTGVVGTGSRVYFPDIFHKDQGEETTAKINNSEAINSEYDEVEVCKEIEEKFGVYPVQFGYRPDNMKLIEYDLSESSNEVALQYQFEHNAIHIYISKDYQRATINLQVDGELLEKINMVASGMEVPVYQFQDSKGKDYYGTAFEYLNTSYTITGMMEEEEFKNILQYIFIENV